jgi:hypothetical protein
MIEHSVSGDVTSVSTRNGQLHGTLIGRNGQVMTSFTPELRKEQRVAGDVISVRELLSAASVSLDGKTSLSLRLTMH